MAKELVGKSAQQIGAILTGASGAGIAANMPIRAAISDTVYQVAVRLGAKLRGRAYLIMLSRGTASADYAALYDKLGLSGDDALIVSDTHRWHIRCGNVPAKDLRLLERQAAALKMLAPHMRFAVVSEALIVAHANKGGISGKAATVTSGSGSGSGSNSGNGPVVPFAAGLLVGAILVLAGVWVGRLSATSA